MPLVVDGTSGVTFNDSSLQGAAASPFGLKNRIINGDMVIDQRNNGASVSLGAGITAYSADRYRIENNTTGTATAQQVSDAPTGFSKSLRYTVTATDTSLTSTENAFIQQNIEDNNVVDLSFGTASAKTITVSFWVKSSITGTFGGSIINSSYSRLYPFSYTITAANTWEYKTVTISGDTSGTWSGFANGIGLRLMFCLAAGSDRIAAAGAWTTSLGFGPTGQTNLMATNGATFQLTGVQLERNTTATPFEWLPYTTELQLCQRYYYRITAPTTNSSFGAGSAWTAVNGYCFGTFPVTMRTRPTALETSGTASQYTLETAGTGRTLTGIGYNATTNDKNWVVDTIVASGQTAGQAGVMYSSSTSAYLGWSAEL